MKDIGSTVGIRSYRGQGYEGVMTGSELRISGNHLYVMVVLSGARIVCVI